MLVVTYTIDSNSLVLPVVSSLVREMRTLGSKGSGCTTAIK
ncbi:hypothetical protein [Colwellia psychrerythraea]|nr:hypothetical protein [Colwellia psychrerythraea]